MFGQPAAPEAVHPKEGEARFEDVTKAARLNYVWNIAGKRPLNILQTIGNGCAFLDYDNDGCLDILLIGPQLALYKGDGKGQFTNVTAAVGLDKLRGHFLGCAVGDIDSDGFDDVYISGYRTGLLLHNECGLTPRPPSLVRNERAGKGETGKRQPLPLPGEPASEFGKGAGGLGRVFRDITVQAGLQPQPWGTSCAFGETRPGSGRLDLYVANYARFDPTTDQQLCPERGVLTSCGPRTYHPLRGTLYLNDGGGRFHDATKASGLVTATGRGLGVGFVDYDGSGRPGLALANDELPGDLFHTASGQSAKQVRYSNTSQVSGTAFDANGNAHAGMGLDWGDYDNDGKPDLFVATYQNEIKCLYHNEGDGLFKDISLAAGLDSATPFVAFGCKFLDYDNDGYLDLVITNGHVLDNVAKIFPTYTYRQTARILHNRGAAFPQFEDVSHTAGVGFTTPIVGRGVATGDFDNDGRVDVLMVDSEGTPLLLHNESQEAGHWLGLKLTGTKSNRDAYGAMVTATLTDGRKIVRACHADGSYMSSSDKRVHVGLGASNRVRTLTVQWPDGHADTINDVAADRYIEMAEGRASVR